ncbi:D-alanyl-D-alanine carboxypeptidase family protein [Actinoplanes sp. NPDC051343]|uniref:D-alanyl-D-alanine carboxypeptidase family protein n=1 Tax=Actinoplanes sp. NPDC051343 TaxID=3363906 RepID=UPI0037AC4BC9
MNSRITDIQSRILALQGKVGAPASTSAPASSSASSSQFSDYLQDAMSATGTGTVSAAGRNFTLNSKGIPTELADYGNGKIPRSALEQVGNTHHRLWAPAAESLTQMMADAKKDGVNIGITDSYRPYDEQVDLAKRKGLYSQGGLAAKPGTSEHGWGMAADLDLNSKAQSWMHQNAAKYGFVNNVSRESWHWAYKPNGV